jgi:tetratricopeptide (TPR) repeat protein/serine/threonine protein kinase
MSTWNPRANDLFLKALELHSADEQKRYLDEACAGDAALRADVEALLEASARAGIFLESPVATLAAIDKETVAERPGTIIGPYKLLQQIGEGGMGTVYMAEQTEPVHRKVALKIIKAGMDSRQIIARFEAERQALALMDHPNIAKVFEAGQIDCRPHAPREESPHAEREVYGCRPYFVMELVKGLPITKYCDEHHLTPRQRLELFIPVCQAVQHAHQKGIIHRDLKPSNVLVAQYDGKPVPKVIDFGIAKAAGPKLTDRTLYTEFGAVVGTFEYMSPEQAELNQLDVDTRSDIYSLGVMLYELLTGTTPLERGRIKQAALLEVLRLIREEEAPRPSLRLSDLGRFSLPSLDNPATVPALQVGPTSSLASISALRQTEPAKLTKLMRGEIDWIVMKALEKDRNRRYETANGFAMDVQRYLADEAVQACPPSAWYRLRKFARRKKTALVVAACVFLALAGVAGGVGWAIRDKAARDDEIEHERLAREAEIERDRLVREAALDQTVESTLSETGPLIDRGKWPEALAVVERADKLLDAAGRTERPQGLMQLQRELTMAQRLEDIYKGATRHHKPPGIIAVGSRTEHKLRAEPDSFEGEFFWGRAQDEEFAQAFRDFGIDVEALPPADAAAQIARRRIRAALVKALDDWAPLRKRARGDDDPGWKQLTEIARQADPNDWRNRCRDAVLRGDRQALEKLAASVAIRDVSPASLCQLANALIESGARDEAVALLRRAQKQYPDDVWVNDYLGWFYWTRFQPPRYDDALRCYSVVVALRPGRWMNRRAMGDILMATGAFEEAIAEYSMVIEMDPKNAANHNNLGIALDDLGKGDEAIVEYRKAIELAPKLGTPHFNLGIDLHAQGKWEEAVAEFLKAIELDPKYAPAHVGLGIALHAQGKREAALAEYRKAIELDPKFAAAHGNLGFLLYDNGDLDGAIAEYRKAIELGSKSAPAHTSLGIALLAQGKQEEAVVEFRKAIELAPRLAAAHNNLGKVLHAQGKWEEAVAEYRKAIELDPKFADAHNSLGATLNAQGKREEALTELRKAIELDPKLAAAHNNLGIFLRDKGDVDGAITEHRKAIELKTDHAEAHCDLGAALAQKGEFREALTEFRRGHELGSKRSGWSYPSAKWVQQCERLVALDAQLPAVLSGQRQPADADERLGLARVCQTSRQFYAAAARFYAEAFTENPRLADDPSTGDRYNAACAAAQAGCGQGKDADSLDDKGRARLRRQALDWLRADLVACRGLLAKRPDASRPSIAKKLQHWLEDSDLAGMRGDKALATLPESECADWQKLWNEVEALLGMKDEKTPHQNTKDT